MNIPNILFNGEPIDPDKKVIIRVKCKVDFNNKHYIDGWEVYENFEVYAEHQDFPTITVDMCNTNFIIPEIEYRQMERNPIKVFVNADGDRYSQGIILQKWMVNKIADSENEPEYFV